MEEKKKIFKQWYFWLIIILLIIVGVLSYFLFANSKEDKENKNTKNNSGIKDIAREIQYIYSDATLYTSAGENTIILELKNFDTDENSEEYIKIMDTLKNSAEKVFDNYSKLIIYNFFDTSGMIAISYMNLPDFTVEKENEYFVPYENYSNLYNFIDTTNTSNESEKGEEITLTTGMYIVGEDIKPGKYDVIAKSGSGNFLVSGSVYVNEILTTLQTYKEDYGWTDRYSNLTIKNGDEIELKNGLTVILKSK